VVDKRLILIDRIGEIYGVLIENVERRFL